MMGVVSGVKDFGNNSNSSNNNKPNSSTPHAPHTSAANNTDAKTHLVSDVVSRLALAAAALESSAALDSQLGPGASALSRRLDKFKSPSLPKKTAIFAAKGLIHTLERQQVSEVGGGCCVLSVPPLSLPPHSNPSSLLLHSTR